MFELSWEAQVIVHRLDERAVRRPLGTRTLSPTSIRGLVEHNMADLSATIAAAIAGDRDATLEIVQLAKRDVTIACFQVRIDQNPELSQSDLVQDAMMRVLLHLPSFRGHEDDVVCRKMFRKWLRRLATHAALNLLQRQNCGKRSPGKRLQTMSPDRNGGGEADQIDDEATPGRNALVNESRQRLLSAINGLPQEEQQIVQLYFGNNQTLAQVGKQLRLSIHQVKYRLNRAIDGLRRKLND